MSTPPEDPAPEVAALARDLGVEPAVLAASLDRFGLRLCPVLRADGPGAAVVKAARALDLTPADAARLLLGTDVRYAVRAIAVPAAWSGPGEQARYEDRVREALARALAR